LSDGCDQFAAVFRRRVAEGLFSKYDYFPTTSFFRLNMYTSDAPATKPSPSARQLPYKFKVSREFVEISHKIYNLIEKAIRNRPASNTVA